MQWTEMKMIAADLAQISGVSLRLCDAQLTTLQLSGDDAPFPVFRTLPTTCQRVERAITAQGDFLALGIFVDQQLMGYLIAGPCVTESHRLARIMGRCVLGAGSEVTLHDDHIKVPPLAVDLAATDSDNDAMVARRYASQNRLMATITQGDTARLPEMLANTRSLDIETFFSRVPNRRLRSAKNILYVFNTMCRIAAERGNISPVVLDRVSSHYAVEIEQLRSLAHHQRLTDEMAMQYCEIVAARRENHYSRKVNQALQFIYRHYQADLSLAEIASAAQAAPTYLSRRFKQETDETIFEFINRYRVQMAQQFLRHRPESVMDVAFRVGFNNVTYFNRTFKRYTGMTPLAYLRGSTPTVQK